MPVEVLELHHHGIRIGPSDDAQKSARELCSGVLGLEADPGRPNVPGIPGFRMYVGGGEQRTRIHLMGAAGESPVARSAEEDPTRPHVALAVEDVQEARRALESRGIRHWTIQGLVGESSDQVIVPAPYRQRHRAPPDRRLPLQSGHARRAAGAGAAARSRGLSPVSPPGDGSPGRSGRAWSGGVAAAFADACRMPSNRIGIFVNLPLASLDELALRERLDEIGRRTPAARA